MGPSTPNSVWRNATPLPFAPYSIQLSEINKHKVTDFTTCEEYTPGERLQAASQGGLWAEDDGEARMPWLAADSP